MDNINLRACGSTSGARWFCSKNMKIQISGLFFHKYVCIVRIFTYDVRVRQPYTANEILSGILPCLFIDMALRWARKLRFVFSRKWNSIFSDPILEFKNGVFSAKIKKISTFHVQLPKPHSHDLDDAVLNQQQFFKSFTNLFRNNS